MERHARFACDRPEDGPGFTLGMGSCPLVMGECVQGRLREGRHFLITSPIGLFAWAEFAPGGGGPGLSVDPPQCTKALKAVRQYLEEEGLPPRGRLHVRNPLEPGQGFGTSTADITASLRAAATAWGRTIEPEPIARLAIAIEPTDGSMYPGCVAFAHREGVLLQALGRLPAFEALVACTGGMVDTVAFDQCRRDFWYSARDEADLLAAWSMVREANRLGDVALLARATTTSARINEQLLPKPFFAETLRFAEATGIEGLMAAHSGTALALILDPRRPGYAERLVAGRRFLSSLRLPAWFQISNQSSHHAAKHHRATPRCSPRPLQKRASRAAVAAA